MEENPIRTLRLDAGLTQEALARLAGVTRQVVTMTEQGLYNKVPVSLIQALARQHRAPSETLAVGPGSFAERLEAAYGQWTLNRRLQMAPYFINLNLSIYRTKEEAWFGLRNYVAGASFSKFCQRLVYQKSLVREYELYGRGENGILRALIECGTKPDQIAHFAALPRKASYSISR